METVDISVVVRRCIDELFRHTRKTGIPDHSYANLVSVLAVAARKAARAHGASLDLATDVEDEVLVHGLRRWLDDPKTNYEPNVEPLARFAMAANEFRYMARHNQQRPARKAPATPT